MQISEKVAVVPNDPLATLQNCGGYYECPKDPSGRRLGPLVAYAGTYGNEQKHKVGDIYLNAARAERFPHVLRSYSQTLAIAVRETYGTVDWVMGVPEGGRAVGLLLAEELGCEYIYPEKEEIAGADQRKESVMKVGRHEIEPNTCGVICEDVCNNFSSTNKIVELVEQNGAVPIGIACLFNRSSQFCFSYLGRSIPVVSVKDVEANQYTQEDPAVVADLQAGNIVWHVKKEWRKLEAAMAAHPTT